MAKKFITFLGTNQYLHCKYKIDIKDNSSEEGKYYKDKNDLSDLNSNKNQNYIISKPVRYVQEALADFYCKNWSSDDVFLVLATEGENGSIKKNWESGSISKYDKYGQEYEKEPKGLKDRLNDLRLPCKIEMVPIPDGTKEGEIWKIIEMVTTRINNKDELYIDITHSFRFIPMIIPPLITFLKTIKDIRLHSIHYGAFETLGSNQEVCNMKIDGRIAPIRELTELYSMIEWAEATNAFIQFGSGKELNKKLEVAKTNIEDNKISNRIKPIIHNIRKIDEALKFNNVSELKQTDNLKLEKKINIDKAPNLYPLKEILPMLENYLYQWSNDKVENGLLATKWSIEKDRVAQALTFLQEAIIDYFIKLFGWEDEKEYRNIVFFVLQVKVREKNKNEFNNSELKEWFAENIDLTIKTLNNYNNDFIKKILKINNWRNMVNHAKKGDRKDIIKNFPHIFNEISKNFGYDINIDIDLNKK